MITIVVYINEKPAHAVRAQMGHVEKACTETELRIANYINEEIRIAMDRVDRLGGYEMLPLPEEV